ncbi:MAG: hypothetical protein HY059_22135 [Proteobacteria bacterium]|nr:hypothetical protein [Pseudomonadota bacterium]
MSDISLRPIYGLADEFVKPLDRYKDWVLSDPVQEAIRTKIEWPAVALATQGRHELASSAEYLTGLKHDAHDGYPPDQFGVNLNYSFLKNERRRVDPAFFEEIRRVDRELDDELQNALGARFCALKMFYPAKGYIAWHTNWNVPGYNIIFTYSKGGDGHWRHVDPAGATTFVPDPKRIVTIDDVPGWHCKVGYFGKKDEYDRIVWHSAHTREPRLTVSYVVFDRAVWDDMVAELSSCAKV